MNELTPHTAQNTPQIVYKPSEIIGIFNSILAKQSVNAQVVYLRGVYLASGRQAYSGYFYDTLRDEDSQEELTLRLTNQQRENLKSGNLVNIGGVISRNINQRGQIQILLNASRISIVQEQAIDETEIKRAELRQKKSDRLPSLDRYLKKLAEEHRKAIRVYLETGKKESALDDFTSLGYTPRDLLQLNRERFLGVYQQTFTPLYQIAQNMGYEVWQG